MATFRRFRPDDVDKFSKCNLDPLTETYELAFYLQYHAKWPALFQVCEDMNGNIIGYSESQAGLRARASSRSRF
jgi:N-terminal acetyltransferase B complex catalytic subunit